MWVVFAGFVLVALAHTAPFPFLLEYIGPGRSMWDGPKTPDTPTVYLTYDDGPNPEATPALLDVLATEDVRATFFIIPDHVTPATAPIVRRAIEDGHGVALHSNTRELMLLESDDLADLLDEQADAIEALVGRRPCRLFRPHAGWRSGEMYEGLGEAGYRLVGWGFSLWDFNWWRAANPAKVARRLAGRVSNGSVVVLHDGHHKNPRARRQRTVDTTAALIPQVRARGFAFDTLCGAGAAAAESTPVPGDVTPP
jgi:peptidoglycan/xylan/chitin deacetylase (PgdA/CDA1 family)